MSPPPDATLVALALPLFVAAGSVSGTALALARSGDAVYYLIDNAAVDGPPVWVLEGEVERCMLSPLPVRQD
jgi:hypothetical protein